MTYKNLIILSLLAVLSSCGKSFVETDPATGNTPEHVSNNPNATCMIGNISQINGSQIYNNLAYQYTTAQLASGVEITEPSLNNNRVVKNFSFRGDTILLDASQWLLQDPVTRYISKMQVIEQVNSNIQDTILYQYEYDGSGKLVRKKCFYNRSKDPDFTTDYSYTGNNITSCKLMLGSGPQKLMESSISYDATISIKPWLYLFTDVFENNLYLQAFSFGIRPSLAVKEINTVVYDSGSGNIIDTWVTKFSGYVLSKDNYVLQVNANGDNQQGLAFLTGTLRFNYSCK